jgi:hypothetical protein
MVDEKDDKKKQPVFNKEEKKWLLIGTFYVLLTLISRIDLVGTALVIFAVLVGLGIKEHGICTREVHVIEKVKG